MPSIIALFFHVLAGRDTTSALAKLSVHIEKGCLEEIPAGCGTNRNERLHRTLNASALNVGRIGPELANALLVGIFHTWNCRKRGQGWWLPLASYPTNNPGPEAEQHVVATLPSGQASPQDNSQSPIPEVIQTRSSNVPGLEDLHAVSHSLHGTWQALHTSLPQVQTVYTASKFALAFQHREEIVHNYTTDTPAPVGDVIVRRSDGVQTMTQALDHLATKEETCVVLSTSSATFPFVPFLGDKPTCSGT